MADSGLSIGVLSGKLDLDAGTFKSEIVLSVAALDELEKRFGRSDSSVRKMAEGVFTAEAALEAIKEAAKFAGDEIYAMSVQGARVGEIEKNFNRLTLSAGQLSDELLNNLQKGTRGTISDFDLMKNTTDLLTKGVKLTEEQYNTLATGAFALAQQKGANVKTVFDDLNYALETGQVRNAKYLIGKIDLAEAEDRYGRSINVSADRLTADEKLQAARVAILAKVSTETKLLGEQQENLDVKVQQSKVAWQNFEEELGKSIATSPIVLRAFDEIKNILTGAFGKDKEESIKTITQAVEAFAQAAVDATRIGVETVKFMYEWRDVIEPVAVGLGALAAGLLAISAAEKIVALTTAFLALNPVVLTVAASATAVYAAFEVGKWQPVSDFFEKFGLEVFYGMSTAAATAAVNTHHLTEAATQAKAPIKELGDAAAEIKLKTDDWQKTLKTVDGSIIDWAEHLLQSGVSAKSVATEYGLTDVQIRALQMDIAAAAKSTGDLDNANTKMVNGVRLSKEEYKQYLDSWINLNSLGQTYQETLSELNPKILGQIEYYVKLGATVQDLVHTIPGLTKAQAEAGEAGVKAAAEVQKVWVEANSIISKSHGDNINEWLRLEKQKYDQTVTLLTQAGRATKEALDAELGLFKATVDAEMQKREEMIPNSKAAFQKAYDDEKNTLDLMKSDIGNFTTYQIQQQTDVVRGKREQLDHWVAASNEAIDKEKNAAHASVTQQREDVIMLASEWEMAGDAIDKTKVKVKALSGEVETLAKYEAQQLAGGSFTYDLTTRAGVEQYRSMNPGAAISMTDEQIIAFAKSGGTLAQLMQSGAIDPYAAFKSGANHASFAEGGYGDFGAGTLAMLHGKELITPIDKVGSMGEQHVYFYINGDAETVYRQLKDRIVNDLKFGRQLSALR